jgi:hypothetical protein
MKEAKLRAAQAVIAAYAEQYRQNKSKLNAAEEALYEAAVKLSLRTLGPKEAKAAIAKFEQELLERRERAEVARLARIEKSKQGAPSQAC